MATLPHLTDLLLLLAVSIPAIVVFRVLKLPALAGFLLTGIAVGPNALGWVRQNEAVETLAEIGVVLLLFTIGLEFSLARLLAMRRQLLIGGGGQLVITVGAITGIAALCGVGFGTAVLFGFLGALSSTAFVLKVYQETRQLETPHGSLTLGVLLFQDLGVIPMMLLIPLLGADASAGGGEILLTLGKGLLAIAVVLFTARYGFPRIAALVVRHGGRELFTLFVVLTALGAAALTDSLGLSLSLGAFVAGLCIAESPYSHQVVSEILPFRDVFNALFFLSIGMLFDPSVLMDRPGLVIGLAAGLVALKFAVMAPVARLLTSSWRVAILTGISVAQVGEFSFILAKQGANVGLIDDFAEQVFLAVSVLTMLCSPFAIQFMPAIIARVTGRGREGAAPSDESKPERDVLIVGYGHTGQQLVRVLAACGISHRVIELNVDSVHKARADGVPIQFGDATSPETLEHAGLRRTRMVVFAINDPAATRRGVSIARRTAPGVHIIVRTRFMAETDELFRLGADQVIPEEFETSIEIFSRVLRQLHVPRGNIAVQVELMRREGYRLLRTGVPPERTMDAVREILAETSLELDHVPMDSPLAGRTLAEINLRARTGVSVLSAVRQGASIHAPGPDMRIEPGDTLVIAGTHAQIEACRRILHGLPPEPDAASDEERND